MENLQKIFAENLKKLRLQKGMTQGQLGEALGYSNKAISKWESGAGMPSLEALLRLSRLLGTELDGLLRQRDPIYYLGIDGGGTKTAMALADASGKLLRTHRCAGCNPVDIGMENARKVLSDGIREILRDIPTSCVSLFAGIAGGTTGDHRQLLGDHFRSLGFHRVNNHNDAQNAIAAGLKGQDGVLAILGTGSIVYAVSGETRHRIGGYGYLFGDAGSGYQLGNLGIQAAFAATDGSGPATCLRSMVEEKAGASFPENIAAFYKGGKRFIASFAPLVLEACRAGDTVALGVLEAAMAAFAPQLTAAARLVKDTDPIVLTGGVAWQEELILPALRSRLPEEIAPRVTVCKEDATIGALILAGAPMAKGE